MISKSKSQKASILILDQVAISKEAKDEKVMMHCDTIHYRTYQKSENRHDYFLIVSDKEY